MNRASSKPARVTRKPYSAQPDRLSQAEIESLRKEFAEDEAWMEAQLKGLEKTKSLPKQQPKHSKTGKPTKPFSYDQIPRSKPSMLDGPDGFLLWPDDVDNVPRSSER